MPYADPLKRAEHDRIGAEALRARQEEARTLSVLRSISIREALKSLPPAGVYRRKSLPSEPHP